MRRDESPENPVPGLSFLCNASTIVINRRYVPYNPMSNDLRRHHRLTQPGAVRLTWQDANGLTRFARGRCLDVSPSGARIETPEPIPLKAYVQFSAEKIPLTTTASVRHVARTAGKYIIGLEFSCPVRTRAETA